LLVFAIIASFCHFFGAFVLLGSAEMSVALDFDLERVEILAKMIQNGKKKQIFGTGLNLALVLHLVQSLIYPGATFSTMPAKSYECPSVIPPP